MYHVKLKVMKLNCYINVFASVSRDIADVSVVQTNCVVSRGFSVAADSSLDVVRKAVCVYSDELVNLGVSEWSSSDRLCLPRLFSLVDLITVLDVDIDRFLKSRVRRFAVDLNDQLLNAVCPSYYNDDGDRFFCNSCRFVLEVNVVG